MRIISFKMLKIQAFPIVMRSSSRPTCLISVQTPNPKLQSLPSGVYPKPSKNSNCQISNWSPRHSFSVEANKSFQFFEHPKASLHFHNKTPELNTVRKYGISFGGHSVMVSRQNIQLIKTRSFSKPYSASSGVGGGMARAGKHLPWLADSNIEESNKLDDVVSVKARATRSSWEVAAEKYLKKGAKTLRVDEESTKRINILEKGRKNHVEGDEQSNTKGINVLEKGRKNHVERDEHSDEVEEDENKVEPIEDPRWDKIKTRVGRVVNAKPGTERPELKRWNRQENWGRKTYREASEGTVPNMVGEGVYGVGPVLAALSAGRREFYTLYVQEGLELSSKNRKRKDKKGFEKVLKLADKMGLSIKEISKHDLNMMVDNRPHQGLVLDASPLEMVSIRQLDPVSPEGDGGLLWVALDEVTDPQNLGAIIRSSYFFGAAGVVLCAKNSAPLSGVVSKASAGSLELMELLSCKNMMQFLSSSAENGWRVIGGSVSSRAVPLNEVSPGVPTILVLGSEGTGLRPLVERSCTELVRIPGNILVDITAGRIDDEDKADEVDIVTSGEGFRSFMAVESLNVSVAAGVLLHHLTGNNHVAGGRRNE